MTNNSYTMSNMIKLVGGLFHNEEQTKQALCSFISNTDRLSIGPQCEQFEQEFATWQGRRHCILFNSGSSANLALVQALLNLERIAIHDQAAFSAITWATNVMPLIQLGLQPVPVDVELTTLNISSRTLMEVLDANPNIMLLFMTDLLGFCGDLDAIRNLCEERNIILIEDVCEALGSVYQGKKLGNWGLASTFSFFVGHHISTIEGGAVCTDDADLDRMLRLVRAHGWDRNLNDEDRNNIRHEHNVSEDFFTNFTFYSLGYNMRPTEITGFLGQQQLQYADLIVQARHDNWHYLQPHLIANPDLIFLEVDHIDLISNFAVPVICRTPSLTKQYVRIFESAGVEIRPIVGGAMTEQPFYRKLYGESVLCPTASLINRQGFYFGNHQDLSPADLETLVALLTPISQPAHLSASRPKAPRQRLANL